MPEVDELEKDYAIADAFDDYINAEEGLPRGEDGQVVHAIVKKREVNYDGNPVGAVNNNPLMDSRMHEAEFIDGTREALLANIIGKNILSQADVEGHHQMILDEILDHQVTGEQIKKGDKFIETSRGAKHRKLSTQG